MSIARVYTVNKSRKEWTCGKCRTVLPVGSKVLSFTVDFRGFEQKRCDKPGCYPSMSERESSLVGDIYSAQESVEVSTCDKPGCYPSMSERESSLVGDIYSAQESVEVSTCGSLEDLESAIQEVVEACEEVARQYEDNPTYDGNDDLQDRVYQIESAAEELQNWADSLEDEPDVESEPSNHEDWLEEAREAAQEALNGMELP